MFHLYQGNDLNRLAERLAEFLKQTDDPLAREVVAVPNPVVGKWLSLRVADLNGFCPDIDFPLPGRFLYQEIFNPLQGRAGQRDISSFLPEVNRWRIYSLLAGYESGRVGKFIAGDVRKRWQLSGRMAELFDGYMTCRQDMLQDWDVEHPDCEWQKKLWSELSRGHTDSFVAVCRRFLSESGFQAKSRRYFFFAVSALPAVHLDCILKLAESTDVHFFMFNPCSELWDDVVAARWAPEETGADFPPCNPLLGNNGRLGRDFLRMLLEQTEWDTEELFVRDRPAGNLLTAIQQDIEKNCIPDESNAPVDDSVSIQVCHSAMRETEVLCDCILKAFADFKDLSPGDVRVVVPDLETYAPYIDVVFGIQQKLPYVLAEQPGGGLHPEYRAFEALLKLPGSKYKSSDVMSLLTCESLRKKFGLSEGDVETLTELLKSAGVAWGLTEESREGMREKYLYSWRFAFDRLIFGEVMASSDQPIAVNGKTCYPEFSAEGRHRVLGGLGEFLDALEAFDSEIRKENRSFKAWINLLRETVVQFFEESEAILAEAIAEVEKQFPPEDISGQAFPFEIIHSALLEQFDAGVTSGNAVSGRIVFCRFQTFGGVPARVIGMLGMNDGVFPRRDDRLGFDLSILSFRRGDRSKRMEDRFAFLQTVLAAKDRLIVTYTGRSEKDNSEVPPSLVVSEFNDVVQRYIGRGETIVTEHPLHPFSPRYFQKDGLITYSQAYYQLAQQIGKTHRFQSDPPIESTDLKTVSLDELVYFLADPIGMFEKTILGARTLKAEAEDLPDEEPFGISKLESYKLTSELLKITDPEPFWTRAYLSGKLPYNPAKVRSKIDSIQAAMQAELTRLNAGAMKPSESVRIFVGQVEIQGTLSDLHQNGIQVFLRPTAMKLKDQVKLAVYHLAAGTDYQSYGIFEEGKRITVTVPDISFEAILELYSAGQTRPIFLSENENETKSFLDGVTPKTFRLLRHFGETPDAESIELARKMAELIAKIKSGVHA